MRSFTVLIRHFLIKLRLTTHPWRERLVGKPTGYAWNLEGSFCGSWKWWWVYQLCRQEVQSQLLSISYQVKTITDTQNKPENLQVEKQKQLTNKKWKRSRKSVTAKLVTVIRRELAYGNEHFITKASWLTHVVIAYNHGYSKLDCLVPALLTPMCWNITASMCLTTLSK